LLKEIVTHRSRAKNLAADSNIATWAAIILRPGARPGMGGPQQASWAELNGMPLVRIVTEQALASVKRKAVHCRHRPRRPDEVEEGAARSQGHIRAQSGFRPKVSHPRSKRASTACLKMPMLR